MIKENNNDVIENHNVNKNSFEMLLANKLLRLCKGPVCFPFFKLQWKIMPSAKSPFVLLFFLTLHKIYS